MRAPDLHPKLVKTLDAFEAEGVELSTAEIAWLVQLRDKCDGRNEGGAPWVMGSPLDYAGVTWWPLHHLAESWWIRADELLGSIDKDRIAVYLFAHANSAPGDRSLAALTDPSTIRKTVRKWRKALPLHKGQEEALCDRLRVLDGHPDIVPDPDAKPIQGNPVRNRTHSFAAAMCKAFPGANPDYWTSGIAANDAIIMLQNASGDGVFATSPERQEAQANYLKAVKWIWINHG